MSTKTTFKRIALVAAASLGLGLMSSIPAAQAVSGITVTATNGTADTGAVRKADSTNAAVITISGLIEATDSITVEITLKSSNSDATGAALVYLTNRDSSTPSLANSMIVDTLAAAANYSTVNGVGANRAESVTYARFAPDTGTATYGRTKSAKTQATAARLATSSAGPVNFTQNFGVQFDSDAATTRSAGTYTYTYLVKTWGAGTLTPVNTYSGDISIVVATPTASSATADTLNSFALMSSNLSLAGGGTSSAADSAISAVATAGTNAGVIFIGNRNAVNTATTAKDSITVTVTGAGVVCTTTSSAGSLTTTISVCGKTLTKVAVTGDYQFMIQGDGNAGPSTIVTTALIAGYSRTSTLSFYASAAKTLTATVATPLLVVGSNDSAISVTGVDAGGNAWLGTPYIYASSAADATAVGGSATTPTACVLNTAKTLAWCPIAATAVGTGKFKVIDASTIALATATSNEVTVTSSSATAATVKLAFDKASYAPGERALITVTPLDSAGKAIPAGTQTNLLASGGITSNVSFLVNGTSGTNTNGYSNTDLAGVVSPVTSAVSGTDKTAGSATYVVFMPLSGASTVTITAKGGTSLPIAGQVAVTASASVNSDAATALAAVTALASQVSAFITKINAQITTLTDLVMKIQKKVKA